LGWPGQEALPSPLMAMVEVSERQRGERVPLISFWLISLPGPFFSFYRFKGLDS